MSALLLATVALLVPGRFEESDHEVYWLLGTGLTWIALEDPDGDLAFDGAGLTVEFLRYHERKHAQCIPGYGIYADGRFGPRGGSGSVGVRGFLTSLGVEAGAVASGDGVGYRVGGLLTTGPVYLHGATEFVGGKQHSTLAITFQMQWYFEGGGMHWILDPPPERRPAR